MRKKSVKIAFGCVLALSMVLSACSSKTDNNGASGSPAATSGADVSNKQVTLKMWSRVGSIGDQMKATIAEFQEKYPNIKIEYTYTNATQYPNMLQAALSGNDLPDIFTSIGNFPTDQLVKLGAIREINDIIPKDKRGEYTPGIWLEGSTLLNGDLYAYPLADPREANSEMFYNKEALKQAGMTEQDLPKTWDELIAFGKNVQTASGGKVYGLVIGAKSFSYTAVVAAQMASAISPEVSTDTNTPNTFNYLTGKYQLDSPGYVQSVEFFKKLLDEKVLHPNSLVMNYREGTALMESGQAVLAFDNYNYASSFKQETWNNFGVAPLPTFQGKPSNFSYSGGGGLTLHVAKSTKNYEEVKLFLGFVKESFFPKLIASGYNYSPIPALNKEHEVKNPIAAQALKIKDEQVRLVPIPANKNPNAIKVSTAMSGKYPKTTLENVIEGYLSGQVKEVKSTLTQITEEYNSLFTDTIKKVAKDGAEISEDDYKFPDWIPGKDYTSK